MVRRRSEKLIQRNANGAENHAPLLRPFPDENGVFYSFNVEVTGVARLYRVASTTP
jgi:hypothetical protein